MDFKFDAILLVGFENGCTAKTKCHSGWSLRACRNLRCSAGLFQNNWRLASGVQKNFFCSGSGVCTGVWRLTWRLLWSLASEVASDVQLRRQSSAQMSYPKTYTVTLAPPERRGLIAIQTLTLFGMPDYRLKLRRLTPYLTADHRIKST